MVVPLPFTVNLYHDGLFQVNPLEYVHFDSRVIDDVSFDDMSFKDFLATIRRLVLVSPISMHYKIPNDPTMLGNCPLEDLHPKKPISHVDSDSDGETNVPLDDVANVVEKIEHENEGNTDNPNPNLQGRFLLEVKDPDDEQAFCGRDVSEGKCAGLKGKKPKTVDDNEFKESLHLSFHNVVSAGLFKGVNLDNSLQVSHLFYANDVVFVGQWCDPNLFTIIRVLNCFFRASCLRINLHKSKLIGIVVDQSIVEVAASNIGCIIRFGKKVKLALRYVRPFEILERISPVAYRLRLPKELSGVHDTFHVSNLKKCLADASLHVPLDEIKVDKTLRFVEEPVEIMDREVKSLKRSRILLVKVHWNSKRGPEFTWEREDHMKSKYPQLFVDRAVESAS
ncbi:hypothetical protein Tco_0843313 [Tanacetum coccineum]|uniref:Tf2-1-like SH3-like domain-containing protein n=1 Tax=Tanacetum coccineum TaxID=301880 RepID=A0ABQ5B5V4_9ASTR